MLIIIFVTSVVTVVIFILTTAFYLITILSEESDDQSFPESFDVHEFVSSPTAPSKVTPIATREQKKEPKPGLELSLLDPPIDSNGSGHKRSASKASFSNSELSLSTALKEESIPEIAASFASDNLDSKSDVKSLDNFSIEHGVDSKIEPVNLKEQESMLASKFGSAIAKQIVDDFDSREVKLGGTPLHWCKSRFAFSKLITTNIAINEVNTRQETALHVAIRRKKLAIMISLLSYDPDINLRNSSGETPLMEACKNNYIVACQLLLVHDADVNKTDLRGRSPRHYSSLICDRYKGTQKSPNAANLILAMLHALGAKRCPESIKQENASNTNDSTTARCTEGCSFNGTYNGNSYNRWPTYQKESLYKRHIFSELINERRNQMRRPILSSRLSNKTDTTASQEPKSRLLCVDGGGLRGVVVCQVLVELQKYLKRPVLDYFDWIGGTSVGAFIVCALPIGFTLKQLKRICFELKDEVFTGRKPYNASFIENVLKRTFGETRRMSEITDKHLAVTTVITDRDPCQLRFFRNYKSPAALLESHGFPTDFYNIMSNHSNMLPAVKSVKESAYDQQVISENDRDPLIWQAVRASAAAPFFFKPYGPFLDGGIISNNPTLDLLSEFFSYYQVRKFLADKTGAKSVSRPQLDLILSLGTGRGKVKQSSFDPNSLSSVLTPNWSIPDLGKSIRAVRDLFRKLMQQSCQTEDHILDRAQAWCSSLNIPYFRINPPLATMFSIDDKRDEQLVNALWQTKLYMRSMKDQLVELAEILDGPTKRCRCDNM